MGKKFFITKNFTIRLPAEANNFQSEVSLEEGKKERKKEGKIHV